MITAEMASHSIATGLSPSVRITDLRDYSAHAAIILLALTICSDY
jgi:hypothetical protein